MRKIKLYAIVSADGYLSREDGDIDWILELFNPIKTDYGRKSFFDSVETVLMNRNHYQILLGYDLCDSVMSKSCILVTEPGFELKDRDEVEYVYAPKNDYTNAIADLKHRKQQRGGDIWLAGDTRLIWAFLENDLVDEIILTVLPEKLENGAKLFPNPLCEEKFHAWTKKYYDNGVIQVIFRNTPKETYS